MLKLLAVENIHLDSVSNAVRAAALECSQLIRKRQME